MRSNDLDVSMIVCIDDEMIFGFVIVCEWWECVYLCNGYGVGGLVKVWSEVSWVLEV